MSSSSPDPAADHRPADIAGLHPVVTGAFVTLRCPHCQVVFAAYQPTFACVALGRHVCPRCQQVQEVWPEEFQAALDRYLPPLTMEEMTRLTAEATDIAEKWYRVESVARWLTYKDINLGEPTERALVSFIAQGLYAAYTKRKSGE